MIRRVPHAGRVAARASRRIKRGRWRRSRRARSGACLAPDQARARAEGGWIHWKLKLSNFPPEESGFLIRAVIDRPYIFRMRTSGSTPTPTVGAVYDCTILILDLGGRRQSLQVRNAGPSMTRRCGMRRRSRFLHFPAIASLGRLLTRFFGSGSYRAKSPVRSRCPPPFSSALRRESLPLPNELLKPAGRFG